MLVVLGLFLLLAFLKFNLLFMSILDKKAITFLENYLNNASPTDTRVKAKKFDELSKPMFMNLLLIYMELQ